MNFRIVGGYIMLLGSIIGALTILGVANRASDDGPCLLLLLVAFFWIVSAIYLIISKKLLRKNEADRVRHEVQILNLKLERAKLMKELKSIESNLNYK